MELETSTPPAAREFGKIVITGATGFLGGALMRRLLEMDADAVGLGRNESAGAQFGSKFRPLDLCDAAGLVSAFEGADTVFHCAALSSPWGPRLAFEQSNVKGTVNVLAACERQKVSRLVHVSTPSIYFHHNDGFAVREDAPLPKPVNDYARTKLDAERLLENGRVPFVILRPRAIFGPGDPSILPRLVKALETGRLRIIGKGDNICDLTHVDNVVDALLLAGSAGCHAHGRKYNITNGEPIELWKAIATLATLLGLELKPGKLPRAVAMTIAGVVETACKLAGSSREPLLTRYGVGVLSSSQTLDIGAARNDLGYEPRITTAEGLRRYAQWWIEERE